MTKTCPRSGLIVDRDLFAEKGGRQLTSICWKERAREKENERKRESEKAKRKRKERERERKGERKRKASETLETYLPFQPEPIRT